MKSIFLSTTLLMLLFPSFIFSQTFLNSGQPIAVAGTRQHGPLSCDAVLNIPLGSAFVFGTQQPDIFVRTGRFGDDTGLFLFPWQTTDKNGVPVFGEGIKIGHPFGDKHPPAGTVLEINDTIHAFWLHEARIVHTIFEKNEKKFIQKSVIDLPTLPHSPQNLVIVPSDDGAAEIILEIPDGVQSRPDDYGGRDPRYRPYDGAGIWRGGLPYVYLYAVTLHNLFKGPAENPRLISKTQHEALYSFHQLTLINLDGENNGDLLAGSRFGDLYYYQNSATSGIEYRNKVHLVTTDGNAQRHPTIEPSPIAYPDPNTGLDNVIVGGEGGLYFYQFADRFTKEGKPIYKDPTPVLQENTNLYAGTLPVPNAVDWDGDDDLDIICGNSEGRILFFENVGNNDEPSFLPGKALKANGLDIHIQPGYRGDIQGPGEARWGYVCPTVADWNGDGLPDILMSDATARHTVYLNIGTAKSPELAAASPLYMDGLDLHGTWRVKPAVARLGEKTAYVALDDDDQFHLYWRIDDYNVADGGKLRLEDDSPIGANFLHAGGTGRLKLNLVDWDMDGFIDLLVGTPRHGSVPNPKNGLPQSLGLPGSAVLFLKNTGDNDKPVFKFPELLKFRGEPIFLGQHACAPTPANFSNSGPDLIVGEEGGRLIYYKRQDLSPK